jgi:hypothetical protein
MVSNAARAWDRAAVQRIVDTGTLDFTITSVTRLFRDGSSDGSHHGWSDQVEAHGVLHGSTLVVVKFNFHNESRDDVGQIGSIQFNTFSPLSGSISLPQLDVYFDDVDGRIARAICEAHRDALGSGQINSGIRLFKAKGAGSVSEKELEQGYSSSSIEILGYVIWATLESTHVPKWQLNPADFDFSLADLPTGWIGRDTVRAENQADRFWKNDGLMWAVAFLSLSVASTAQNWASAGPALLAFLCAAGPIFRKWLREERSRRKKIASNNHEWGRALENLQGRNPRSRQTQ